MISLNFLCLLQQAATRRGATVTEGARAEAEGRRGARVKVLLLKRIMTHKCLFQLRKMQEMLAKMQAEMARQSNSNLAGACSSACRGWPVSNHPLYCVLQQSTQPRKIPL